MRFFVFFIFYLLISPAFATVQLIEFDAKSTFVGKKALVIASRKTLQEVDQLIKTYNNSSIWGNSKPNWQIFLSSNGWYGISLGMGTNADCDKNKVLLINNNLIPKDSFCSSGKKYIKHISHNGTKFYLTNFYLKAENFYLKAGKVQMKAEGDDNSSLASYSDEEICSESTFKQTFEDFPSWYSSLYNKEFVAEAKNRKLKCGVLTPEEKEAQKKLHDEAHEKALGSFNQKRLLRAKNNPGFRDIKPGMTSDEIYIKANCRLTTQFKNCYGLDNMNFSGSFSKKYFKYSFTNVLGDIMNKEGSLNLLTMLTIDLGPVVSGGFFSGITSEGADDGDIFNGMRNTLNKKYTIDFEFSERDRELFNEREKSNLLVVYQRGKVVLRIWRKKEEYSSKIRLHLEYREPKSGADFIEANKPNKAFASDF